MSDRCTPLALGPVAACRRRRERPRCATRGDCGPRAPRLQATSGSPSLFQRPISAIIPAKARPRRSRRSRRGKVLPPGSVRLLRRSVRELHTLPGRSQSEKRRRPHPDKEGPSLANQEVPLPGHQFCVARGWRLLGGKRRPCGHQPRRLLGCRRRWSVPLARPMASSWPRPNEATTAIGPLQVDEVAKAPRDSGGPRKHTQGHL